LNNGDQALSLVYLLGCLMLVGSALVVRRLPMRQSFKMVAAWLLIFGAAFAVFALRDDFRSLGHRLLAEGKGEPVVEGHTVRIHRQTDGHFWVDGQINGQTVRFLVDSGATVTVISKQTAQRIGIASNSEFPVAVGTANGTVFMRRAAAGRLTVGPIERRDFPVWVAQGDDDLNVLGMNFLSSLSGWGTEDGWLVLRT
jgi:aspartyl protease family protein